MKYHYQIIDERYPDDIFVTSRNFIVLKDGVEENFKGFDTADEAYDAGLTEMLRYGNDLSTLEVVPSGK